MKGWTTATLSDVCTLITDGTHHSPVNTDTGAYKYVTAKNIRPWGLDLGDISYVDEEVHRGIYARCPVEYGDVLYIKDGVTTGIAALNTLREPFSMLSSVALLKPNRDLLHPAYLKHWLNSPVAFRSMTAGMTGTAIKRLVLKQIRVAELPLAPFAEQQRIADKLDKALARVDACRERLDRVSAILKRFRKSILLAAISGRLTEDWRADIDQHQDAGAPRLLDEWIDSRIELVASVGTGSTPLRSESGFYASEGVPWITSAATGNESVRAASEYVTDAAIKAHRLKRFPVGTLLVAMYGEGKTRGQVTELAIEATINQACAAIVVDESKALRSFVKLALQANYMEMRELAEGGNQPNLNLAKIKGFPLRLPPLSEQQEIARRVAVLFSCAVRLEARLGVGLSAVEALTPAVLAKAFRGELVPQDSHDEPAAELLKRLAEQRSGTGRATKDLRTKRVAPAPLSEEEEPSAIE